MIQHDVRVALAALPVSLDPKYSAETKRIYAPHQSGATDGITVARDVAYGPHERHRLDVYHVAGTRPTGAVVYVPGGGFTGGDKGGFANVCSYFARRGMLGVAINYRLTPQVRWPSGAEDVDHAVAWVMCGRRPRCKRILACGLRSGASHVCGLLMRRI